MALLGTGNAPRTPGNNAFARMKAVLRRPGVQGEHGRRPNNSLRFENLGRCPRLP